MEENFFLPYTYSHIEASEKQNTDLKKKKKKKKSWKSTAGRNANWCSHYGEQYGGFSKK